MYWSIIIGILVLLEQMIFRIRLIPLFGEIYEVIEKLIGHYISDRTFFISIKINLNMINSGDLS